MKLMKFVCVLLAFALLGAACTNDTKAKKKDESSVTTTIDTNKIKNDENLTDKDKSEQLALAGEQLMMPGSFFFADKIFDEALTYDKDNKRAQFYKALNAPFMHLKGIYTRIEPIVMKDTERTQNDYKETLESSKYEVAIKDFLLDGEKDIDSEAKVQDFISLNINFPQIIWEELGRERGDSICTVTEESVGIFITNCKKDFNLFRVTIERADAEAIQHIAAGMVIYYNILTAYDATGIQEMSLNFKDQNNKIVSEHISDKEIYDQAVKHAKMGTLKADNKLKGIIGLGSDALAGVRWAQKIQDQLCPATNSYRVQEEERYNPYRQQDHIVRREGKVFEEGFCISEKTSDGKSINKILKTVELALAGNIITVAGTNKLTGDRIETHIKYSNLVMNPVQDLKTLPKEFNECGNVASLTDDTINGVFVNNDATEYGQLTGSLDKNDCDL